MHENRLAESCKCNALSAIKNISDLRPFMGIWKLWLFPTGVTLATGQAITPLSYREVIETIRAIDTAHPGCMRVYDALKEYPDLLDDSSQPLVCTDNVACEYLVIEMGDVSNTTNPQVLLSGAVHGDEQPGPVAVVETVRLICEGVTGLTFLDKSLIVIPTANSWGYSNVNRTENGVDPNRDFPYERDPSLTLESMAAKVVNRIFAAAGNVQSGITFHAGISSITYPWGSPNHMGDIAPDNTAMEHIALEMRNFGGKTNSAWNYETGDMNHIVYPIEGGMEDWAYSLGFEKSPYCGNETLNIGSSPICTNALPSASMFLVEASDDKLLPMSGIGDRDDVWDATETVPVIPRLIRMSLRVFDLVKPRARIIPMIIDGMVPLEVGGCQEVSSIQITCDHADPYTVVSDPIKCVPEPILLPSNITQCYSVTIDISFDNHWKSSNGQLKYTKNRKSILRESPSGWTNSTCVTFGNSKNACFTLNHFYIHPGLIRYKPSVYFGGVLVAKDVTSSLTEIVVTQETIQTSPVVLVAYNQSVKFSADIYKHSSLLLVWILLACLLAISASLITYALLRRRRSVYGVVASATPTA